MQIFHISVPFTEVDDRYWPVLKLMGKCPNSEIREESKIKAKKHMIPQDYELHIQVNEESLRKKIEGDMD
eukprot:snap_masked-scaffold_41-processed-gene-2.82-mRNA-1 protein AED:1.00 eAED:1.00 QI:0/0/0/0/1/1/2/0/69